jgi:hypothetical protein
VLLKLKCIRALEPVASASIKEYQSIKTNNNFFKSKTACKINILQAVSFFCDPIGTIFEPLSRRFEAFENALIHLIKLTKILNLLVSPYPL